MSSITIINIFDGVNTSTYTHNQYYTTEDQATVAINALATYRAQICGGQFIGFVPDEGGFVIKNDQGEISMIYSVQTLEDAAAELIADRIV